MTQCPSDLRLWCAPKTSGVAGLSLQELADLLTPLLPGAGAFTGLTDTPSNYTGQGNEGVVVNAGETGLAFSPITFLAQTDTPVSYTGQGGKIAQVNAGETALEFATAGGGGGTVKQIIESSLGTLLTGTATIPFDNTIPQQTEGFEVLTATITPQVSTNSVLVTARVLVSTPVIGPIAMIAIFRDATANSIAANYDFDGNQPMGAILTLQKKIAAIGSTSPTTFKVRVGLNTVNTLVINGDTAGVQVFGGVAASNLTITEFTP